MKDLIKTHYKEAKESRDPEIINNFLIELGKSPKHEYLNLLDFFINDLEEQLYKKVKLNLIYVIGEIGNLTALSNDYLQLLYNTYYISDRWIRNEIIQSIEKISKKSILGSNIIELIGNAVNDEYTPISKNALKLLLKQEKLPNIKNIFQILNSKDSKIVEYGIAVLVKFIPNSTRLFDSLNTSNNYKILKVKSIRTILLFYFKSLIDLEFFRELIINSSWENKFKEIYLKEIEFFGRISLKNM